MKNMSGEKRNAISMEGEKRKVVNMEGTSKAQANMSNEKNVHGEKRKAVCIEGEKRKEITIEGKKRKEITIEGEKRKEINIDGASKAQKIERSKKPKEVPQWVHGLLGAKFWKECEEHSGLRRSDLNFFCTDCCEVFCPHCAHNKVGHCLLQVRRYVYRSVLRTDDIRKFVDLSRIQTYTINKSKAVHIKPMKQTQNPPNKATGAGPHCIVCGRSITNAPNKYCSIACKLKPSSDNEQTTLPKPSSSSLSPQLTYGWMAEYQGRGFCFSLRRRPRKQMKPKSSPFY